MSTNEQLDSGGGGGGGGTSTSDDSTSGGSVTFDESTGTFVLEVDFWRAFLAAAPRSVRVFLLGLATLSTAAIVNLIQFADDPVGFIRAVIEEIIFRDILLPAGARMLALGLQAVAAITGFFELLGTAFALVLFPLTAAFTNGAVLIINGFNSFNLGVEAALIGAGAAALPYSTGLAVAEIGAVVWLAWIGVRSIDVPFLDPVGFLTAATRPIRNFLGGLFG